MTVIGVDPGATGAIAIIDDDGELIDVADLEAVGGVNSPALLRALVLDLCHDIPQTVTLGVVEAVHGGPRMGAATARKLGQSAGAAQGVLVGLGIPVADVRPAVWKRHHHLGADKAAGRDLAARRWPDHAAKFRRVRDDGRADAALIAAWGLHERRRLLGATT